MVILTLNSGFWTISPEVMLLHGLFTQKPQSFLKFYKLLCLFLGEQGHKIIIMKSECWLGEIKFLFPWHLLDDFYWQIVFRMSFLRQNLKKEKWDVLGWCQAPVSTTSSARIPHRAWVLTCSCLQCEIPLGALWRSQWKDTKLSH